jgi:endonuclease/exonuclease/phosphatase family metal-dependent hydrolase
VFIIPLLCSCLFGCDANEVLSKLGSPGASPTERPVAGTPVSHTAAAGDTIKVASFNIQVFGTSKLKKQHVMDALTQIVRQFDIVAIQEIRSTDDGVLPKFVAMINADGAAYDFVIGPRLGRTTSKEQYAFVFNTARIEVDRSSLYTQPDPRDLLHREPFVAGFRTRGVSADAAFSFQLVNIHTDPDETDTELDALGDVFSAVQNNGRGEDDVILLGDLNVDDRHLGKLGTLPGIVHALSGVKTNTRKTSMYDNIVFDRRFTTEYTGRSGVFDLMNELGISQQQALEISDHMPVWAEFSVFEHR